MIHWEQCISFHNSVTSLGWPICRLSCVLGIDIIGVWASGEYILGLLGGTGGGAGPGYG